MKQLRKHHIAGIWLLAALLLLNFSIHPLLHMLLQTRSSNNNTSDEVAIEETLISWCCTHHNSNDDTRSATPHLCCPFCAGVYLTDSPEETPCVAGSPDTLSLRPHIVAIPVFLQEPPCAARAPPTV